MNKINYYRGNYKQAAEDLSKIQWDKMVDMHMNESWDFFMIILEQSSIIVFLKHVSIKRKQSQSGWMHIALN